MNTYTIFLEIHSILRWIILLLVVVSIAKSVIGLTNKSPYQKIDNALAGSFVGFMHLQLLLGIILYAFLSPWTTSAFEDFGGAMKDDTLRFWAVEHITVMVLAVVLAQIGRSKSKKSSDNQKKFRSQLIFFTISLLLMVLSIPWDRL